MELEKKEVDDSHPYNKIQELEDLLKKMDEEIKVDGEISTATKLRYHEEHKKIPNDQIETKYYYLNAFIKRVN